MTINKALVRFTGQTDEDILEVGKMESSMEEDIISFHREEGDMDSGSKEPRRNGLTSQSITDIAVNTYMHIGLVVDF
jgi:hypothetical protein